MLLSELLLKLHGVEDSNRLSLLQHQRADSLPVGFQTDPKIRRQGLQVSVNMEQQKTAKYVSTNVHWPSVCGFLCSYYIRTISLKLPVSGCSFECYREEEVKSCCPGYWGPDCVGKIQTHRNYTLQKTVKTLTLKSNKARREVKSDMCLRFSCRCPEVWILQSLFDSDM